MDEFRPVDQLTPEERRAEQDWIHEEVGRISAEIAAAEHRRLRLARRFEELGGPHDGFYRSAAQWFARASETTVAKARARLQLAERLESLPQTDAAMARGALTETKARLVANAATPKTEAKLLAMAGETTGDQLRKLSQLFSSSRKANEPPLTPDQLRLLRKAHVRTNRHGLRDVRLTCLNPDEVDTLLNSADRALVRSGAAASETPPDLPKPSRVDGLLMVAEDALARDEPPRTNPGRHELLVVVDPELKYGVLPSGQVLPTSSTARLTCHASITKLGVDPNGVPLDLGRRERTVSPGQLKALRVRDGGCRFPGCTNHAFVEGHHLDPWSLGGPTDLANLILLCRFHHMLVHEVGYRIELGPKANVRVWDPRGNPLTPRTPPRTARAADLTARHEAAGLEIDSRTARAFYGVCQAREAASILEELEARAVASA